MGVSFTTVDAVVDRGIDDDGFFNFDVNLKPSAVQSFIRMAWPGSSDTASSNIEYKFDKGVTIDPVTGLLVLPPGVSQFSLKRLIREEDSDDFLANAQLELNGRGVSEPDDDLVKTAAAKPAIVTRLQAVRVSAFEGQRFVVKVYVSGPGVVKLSLKGLSGANPKSDFLPQSAWTFTNGLRWAPDKTSIIVPPGRKSFYITITTKQDAIPENIESFLLTIGNKTQPLIVQPTAEVTSLVCRSRLEGGNLIFSFRLTASNFKTYLPIGARFSNGDKADVAKITNWRPTAGVKLSQSGFFIIPPRVTAFDLYVPTIDDAI